MSTLRSHPHTHDTFAGTFEATHVLDNSKHLSHVSLRTMTSAEMYNDRQFMRGYQIARCRKAGKYDSHHCDMAWAWTRGTAQLGEIRCPNCNGVLEQTTLAYRRPFYIIAPDAVRIIATEVLWSRLSAAYKRLEADEEARKSAQDDRERMRMDLLIDRERQLIQQITTRLAKVQKNRRHK